MIIPRHLDRPTKIGAANLGSIEGPPRVEAWPWIVWGIACAIGGAACMWYFVRT